MTDSENRGDNGAEPQWTGPEPLPPDREDRSPPAPAGPPPPPEGPWKFWATMGWMLLIFAALMIASIPAMMVYALAFGESLGELSRQETAQRMLYDGDFIWISEIFTVLAVGAVLAAAMALRGNCPPREYLALEPPSAKALLFWLAALVVFVFAADAVLKLTGINPVSEWMTSVFTSADYVALMLFAIILGAPIIEEIAFRGFVLKGVQASLGNFWAVVFATVPWALLHLQYEWYYITVAVLEGVLFSVARIRTNSVLTPIAMHMLANMLATVEVWWIGN